MNRPQRDVAESTKENMEPWTVYWRRTFDSKTQASWKQKKKGKRYIMKTVIKTELGGYAKIRKK